ncbi:amidase [Orrella marina]|nr:amidase [Orrella marina]
MQTHWMTATEIAQAYRNRSLSPRELVKDLLDRIETVDSRTNAFLQVQSEDALAQAKTAENDFMKGRLGGPLHGIPFALKDIIDVAGQRTSCHSSVMLDHVATQDAVVVNKLRAAQAINLGKLALHEFAIGGPSFDLPFPPARNPWNLDHHPGGSSSGSGSAVAAGLVPLALGTDTGGSVRHPAAACGIVGLKPTYDLVSRQGVFPLAFSLDHVGPMTRSVADAALLLQAIASPPGATVPFDADLDKGVRGMRVGFVRHFHEQDMVADAEMAASLEAAATVFKELGASVVDIQLPSLDTFASVQKVIQMSECWTVHHRWLEERPQDYARMSRRKLLPGAFLGASDYVMAMQQRGQLIQSVNEHLRDVDVLLVVNSMEPACRIDDEAAAVRTYPRQARAPFNLTGHPALALMSGLSSAGLPLSLQLVGRMYDEATVLRFGAAYERETGWQKQHPGI